MARDAHFETIPREVVDALDRLNCGIMVRDASRIIQYVNQRLLGWLGYEEHEVVGQPIDLLIPPELDERVWKEIEALDAGDCRARLTFIQRKDSTTFPILVLPQRRGPEDRGKPYVAVAVDLGTIQTAKPASYGPAAGLRADLERIALEIQSAGLSAGMGGGSPFPLGHPDLDSLSQREREVLAHLVAGERVSTIARSLHISPHTVRNHLKSVYRQLNVGGQAELLEHVRALATPGI